MVRKLSEEFKDIEKREGQVYIAVRAALLCLKGVMKKLTEAREGRVDLKKVEDDIRKEVVEAIEALGVVTALSQMTFREARSGEGLAHSKKTQLHHIFRMLRAASETTGAKESSLLRRAMVELEEFEIKE